VEGWKGTPPWLGAEGGRLGVETDRFLIPGVRRRAVAPRAGGGARIEPSARVSASSADRGSRTETYQIESDFLAKAASAFDPVIARPSNAPPELFA
jgi:hypothetical protein